MIEDALETSLADGTRIVFRLISPDDKQRLQEGVRTLSPETQYRRFFQFVDHFTAAQLRYLTEVDLVNHVAWIALLADEPGEPAVGVARWVRMPDDPGVAEGAVVVADAYQSRGIGKTLLLLAARSAIERGIKAFRVFTLGENAPVAALLQELGAVPGRWDGGVLEWSVALPDDVAELDETPAPLILRATATGALAGALHDRNTAAARLAASETREE